ncbi:hypothetical protein RFI_12247, partial [Reticulomyxa filosa]
QSKEWKDTMGTDKPSKKGDNNEKEKEKDKGSKQAMMQHMEKPTHGKGALSVFTMEDVSALDHSKISSQLSGIKTKEGLVQQLQAANYKVATKKAAHEEKVVRSRKELMDMSLQYRDEKTLWRKYAVIELQDLCEVYYKAKMKYYHTIIDVEMKYAETCQVKYEKLDKSLTAVSGHLSQWTLEDVRSSVLQALEIAYSIRLSKEVMEKRDELKSIQVVLDEYEKEYLLLKQEKGNSHVDMTLRSHEVIKYLTELIGVKRNFDKASKDKSDKSTSHSHTLEEIDEFVHVVLDEKKRRQIQCYILDERVKEGIMCKTFRESTSKNAKNTTLEEIYEFVESLIAQFTQQSFPIDKLFNGKDLSLVQAFVKVLVYDCVFIHIFVVRDAVRICLDSDRGKQEYKQLKKIKHFAYFIIRVDTSVGSKT